MNADRSSMHTRSAHAANRPAGGALGAGCADSRRDGALTAGILGFFAMAWFGWGQADASGALSVGLGVGSAVALIVAAIGAFGVWRRPRAESAMSHRSVRRRYAVVVGTEFALCGAGALALNVAGAPDYVPVWICAVVGLHFCALAAVLKAPALVWLGIAVTAVAVEALVVGALTSVAPGNVTGAGAGLTLLVYAVLLLVGPITTTLRGDRHARR